MRPRRPILLLLAAAALLAPLTAHAAEPPPAPERITGAYARSDFFWTWNSALLLHVDVTPHEQTLGYVRSTGPYLLDCPNACTRPFAAGQTVELHAYPSPGASFAGWGGSACEGQGNPCTFTIAGDAIVTANFAGRYREPETVLAPPLSAPSTYALTVVPDGLSLVESSPAGIFACSAWPPPGSGVCSASFAAGAIVTLTNVTRGCPGSVWGGAGTTTPAHERAVLMDADKLVTADVTVC
jgi:hypothetical protein